MAGNVGLALAVVEDALGHGDPVGDGAGEIVARRP